MTTEPAKHISCSVTEECPFRLPVRFPCSRSFTSDRRTNVQRLKKRTEYALWARVARWESRGKLMTALLTWQRAPRQDEDQDCLLEMDWHRLPQGHENI